MPLTLTEIYNHPRYKHLSDQLENHQLAAGYILQEIAATFPAPEGCFWRIYDNLPCLATRVEGRGLND